MPPIRLTNRGLNATICCLSQLCKYSRLTNWPLLSLQPQAEKRRPWGNVYYHLFFLPHPTLPPSLNSPTVFRPSCSPTFSLMQPYFLPHAALASSSLIQPSSSLMNPIFFSHAALLPLSRSHSSSIMQPFFLSHAAILSPSCSPLPLSWIPSSSHMNPFFLLQAALLPPSCCLLPFLCSPSSSLMQPFFLSHAALLPPSCIPSSSLIQAFILSLAALLPLSSRLLSSLLQSYFFPHAALLPLSCSPISFHIWNVWGGGGGYQWTGIFCFQTYPNYRNGWQFCYLFKRRIIWEIAKAVRHHKKNVSSSTVIAGL
jgi:hypothetical protein